MAQLADSAFELLVGTSFLVAIAASLVEIIKASIASNHALEG